MRRRFKTPLDEEGGAREARRGGAFRRDLLESALEYNPTEASLSHESTINIFCTTAERFFCGQVL